MSVRVLHVIPAVAPRYGGPSTTIVPMCRALSTHGADVVIATTDADGPGQLSVPIGTPTSWQDVRTVFFKRTWSESVKYSPSLSRWLAANVYDFDVVHIHAILSHACLAAASACRESGVPYVVRPLGTLAPWSLRQRPIRKRLFLAMAGRQALRRAAAIHYTSTQEKRAVERDLELSRGVVIPLGVDPSLLAEPVIPIAGRNRDPYVLALSRIHPKKNLEALIMAFAALPESDRRDWRLVIAGTGEARYLVSLKLLVAEIGAVNCVQFVGWVEGERKRDLVEKASLVALCSKHENFAVSVLEGLAAGVPALISRHVDLAEEIDRARAGWVIEDDTGVRSALIEAIRDGPQRESRGVAARELARRFAWPGVAAELMRLYETIRVQRARQTGRLGVAAV